MNKGNVRSHIKRARPSSPHIVNTRNVCIMGRMCGTFGILVWWVWCEDLLYEAGTTIKCGCSSLVPIQQINEFIASQLDLIHCNQSIHWKKKSSEIAWRIGTHLLLQRGDHQIESLIKSFFINALIFSKGSVVIHGTNWEFSLGLCQVLCQKI
jgi:hypothetical protein